MEGLGTDAALLGILWYVVFLFSTTLHEASHAFVAPESIGLTRVVMAIEPGWQGVVPAVSILFALNLLLFLFNLLPVPPLDGHSGVMLLMQSLAQELAPQRIRVNAISAGPVRTLAARSIAGFTEMERMFEERAPLRRHIEAADVATASAYLLSDEARHVTGTTLYVDSGYHAMGM